MDAHRLKEKGSTPERKGKKKELISPRNFWHTLLPPRPSNSIKRGTCNFLAYSVPSRRPCQWRATIFSSPLFPPPTPRVTPRRETVHRGEKYRAGSRHSFILRTHSLDERCGNRPDARRPEVNIIPVGASSSPGNATMRRLYGVPRPFTGERFA